MQFKASGSEVSRCASEFSARMGSVIQHQTTLRATQDFYTLTKHIAEVLIEFDLKCVYFINGHAYKELNLIKDNKIIRKKPSHRINVNPFIEDPVQTEGQFLIIRYPFFLLAVKIQENIHRVNEHSEMLSIFSETVNEQIASIDKSLAILGKQSTQENS